MSYQVLYRKYRPQTFEDIVGQEYIVKTLQNAIKEHKLAHAYLFCGPRGTGKTSIARIFAKAINCTGENVPCETCENCKTFNEGSHPDIIELDAASNNQIDNIRDLVNKTYLSPMMGKYKIYIIDEVHMLSSNAFSVFLKTIEEPPANVIFILATTEPQKVINTVISRCQRFNFHKISKNAMLERLKLIMEKEGYPYEEEALKLIIDLSDGGMRDVLSLLEQALAYGAYDLKTKDVQKVFGVLSKEEMVALVKALLEHNVEGALNLLEHYYEEGADLEKLLKDLIVVYKDILYLKNDAADLLEILSKEEAQELSQAFDTTSLLEAIDVLFDTLKNAKLTKEEIYPYIDVALIKLSNIEKDRSAKKSEEKKEVIIKEAAPVKVVQEEIKEEESKNENEIEERPLNIIEKPLEFYLAILKKATREEKQSDQVIYERIADLQNDLRYRLYYEALKDSEIFADDQEAIIFCFKSELLARQLNDSAFNKELYFFFKNEFKIDKMLYAIDNITKAKLIEMYRHLKDYDLDNYHVEKYEEERSDSFEDKLRDFFGADKVKVED